MPSKKQATVVLSVHFASRGEYEDAVRRIAQGLRNTEVTQITIDVLDELPGDRQDILADIAQALERERWACSCDLSAENPVLVASKER